MNHAQILKQIIQKYIDATVVIMSDTRNKQTSIDTVKMGGHCFLSKEYGIPNNCSQILFQILDIAS
jgi:DNA-binding NarL/FixJ family response regulator